ncbi:hypothetical protein BDC45DRAFT_572294 [Circinella umbellata]|nr:hypothetical protein BDC45DRAFT_572294 [Circinella umbellata]
MQEILQLCEQHSYNLGYRWNPKKCVIVQPPNNENTYTLYDTQIPTQSSFIYLGIPINYHGQIDIPQLIDRNSQSALKSMRMLNNIGLNPSGLSRHLSSQLYSQFIRPKLEYGLAISTFKKSHLISIEKTQNLCIRMIYGAHHKSETKIMRHLVKMPSMSERIAILQAKFVYRAEFLPSDALFTIIRPVLEAQQGSFWSKLKKKSPIIQQLPEVLSNLTSKELKAGIRLFLQNNLNSIRSAVTGSKLLSCCLPNLSVDPIMWLPMTNRERSRCIRWRLGWLPGGRLHPCNKCHQTTFSKKHAIQCLNIHNRLHISYYQPDPVSFFLNQLPKGHPTSPKRIQYLTSYWPILCSILMELDSYHHPTSNQQQYQDPNPGAALIKWITPTAPQVTE